ncbi:MAG: arsenate reductase (glutaredoxin) [Sporocytophaga sp.]|uniref:arsenate reductase (glutaredoxin) n=1 Tax=Sporocytophaga sp. TaxID=2231183 RepID=UPI001B16ADF0|nr:arsenate reductase (glutaredoxin) [Sporocytophaga sp.]MBO9702486.1 arsenate reductase (glutaredoxin) [Sporocytophaga sp.]
MIQMLHNPRCTKSRQALAILTESGENPQIIEYLKNPPTIEELQDIITKLKIKPEELVRKKEPLYIENFKGKSFTDKQWIKILKENPVLIERPILIKGNKAVIGREEAKVRELL